MKIQKDEFGLFARVGGWIARPHNDEPTKYKEDDKITGKHFGGSEVIGIGKLPGRGKYTEYWKTTIPGYEYDAGIAFTEFIPGNWQLKKTYRKGVIPGEPEKILRSKGFRI